MPKPKIAPLPEPPETPELQLSAQRRAVDFDTYDIHMQQLVAMVESGQIKVSPAYQRKFRWDQKRCSQFIESIMLGIPIPSLFMATNADGSWEVVDGVQRLSAILQFAGDGELRANHKLNGQLILDHLEKLKLFNKTGLNGFSPFIQNHFATRSVKVITLNDKSDTVVRYDLFERLNTGGVTLSPQEIRDCIYRGPFADKLEEWSVDPAFRSAVKLTPKQQKDATAEECVLRFFAFRARYKEFDHNVTTFLNSYMESSAKKFAYAEGNEIFHRTFKEIARVLPNGIRRPGGKSTTPLNLFEGIAVGAALALQTKAALNATGIEEWIKSSDLNRYTTGATNDRSAVKGRIEFCRDRFLGIPYVPTAKA